MKNAHKYSSGNFFTPNAKFFGYIALLFSVGLIFWTFFPEYSGLSKIAFTLFLLPLSMYLTFTTYGVEVDFNNKTIQDYKMIMGFIEKKGELKSIKYNYVTVLPQLRSYSMQTRANMGTSVSERMFLVVLISDNCRRKEELLMTSNKEKAYEFAKEIATGLELEFIQYDPKKYR